MQITFTHGQKAPSSKAPVRAMEPERSSAATGFRPNRHLPGDAYWHLPHSRDKRAMRWEIDQAAEALRTAGRCGNCQDHPEGNVINPADVYWRNRK